MSHCKQTILAEISGLTFCCAGSWIGLSRILVSIVIHGRHLTSLSDVVSGPRVWSNCGLLWSCPHAMFFNIHLFFLSQLLPSSRWSSYPRKHGAGDKGIRRVWGVVGYFGFWARWTSECLSLYLMFLYTYCLVYGITRLIKMTCEDS